MGKRISVTMIVVLAAAAPAAVAQTPPTPTVEDSAQDAPSEDDDQVSGWFRVDTDSLTTQFWLGATHRVGPVAIASDIYVVGAFAEFDIGPALSFGPVSLTPMAGIGFDFSTTDVASIIAPQLFTIVDLDYVYFESWIQVFLNSPVTDVAEDSFYTRNFLLAKLSSAVAIGPQVEVTYRINSEPGMFSRALTSIPVGGRVNLGYGKNNTLGIFLGYDSRAESGSDNIAGRFSFVRTW